MKYLFLLCSAGDGSSILKAVLGTCNNSIILGAEGDRYFGEHGVSPWTMNDVNDIMDPDRYNWDKIKEIWNGIWPKTNPKNTIYLVKSPYDIFRFDIINIAFDSPRFILMTRNPYVTIEGLLRKDKMSIDEAIKHWCLLKEKHLAACLLDNVIYIKYEDLCVNKNNIKEKIISFMPEFNDLVVDPEFFFAHQNGGKGYNMSNGILKNKESKARLTTEQVSTITFCLKEESEWLEKFEYNLM